ncbi:MAG: cytidylate kinase-like family protein [Nitrospinota bacterium]|nr:cytidylate kinase-like family protein [Nitrospinota bacterium]
MKASHFPERVVDLNFYRDWIAKRRAEEGLALKKRTFFVTISRDYGCEGWDLAEKLMEKLNREAPGKWSLFTRQMIEHIVSDEELDPEMIHQISEKKWSFKDWFVDALVPDYLQSQSSHVFRKMKNFILNLADKGNCVILGAGAQAITHRLDPEKFFGVHIRVTAPDVWKLRRVEHVFKLNREAAERKLKENQDTRDKFMADFTGYNSHETGLYTLVFNNAVTSSDMMAEMIIHYLKLQRAFQ